MFTWLKTYTVFDTETTSLSPEGGGEIIEIAGVKIIGGEITAERFEQLIRPARTITPETTRISGITQAMVNDQPPAKEVLPRFLQWAEGSTLVAQNFAFDMGFVTHHCRTLGIPYAGNDVLDTMLLYKKLYPKEKAGLDAIIEKLQLTRPEQRHRALADALITAAAFIRLMRLTEDKGWDPFETLRLAREFVCNG